MVGLVSGKVGLVTGGGAGIGRATALLMAKEGAAGVAVAGKTLATVQAVVDEIKALGGKAIAIGVDISDVKQSQAMVDAVMAEFGRLDCAVNNAGLGGFSGMINEMDDAFWHTAINTNLTGTAFCLKYESAAMVKGGKGGSIVNISSTAGIHGMWGGAAYTSSKHGMLGLTKVAALDLAVRGIRVNTICPGAVMTKMISDYVEAGVFDVKKIAPLQRAGDPNEIAEAAVWLCSDRSSYVTGAMLPVDGGQTAGPMGEGGVNADG